jgi:hypothetical protein
MAVNEAFAAPICSPADATSQYRWGEVDTEPSHM